MKKSFRQKSEKEESLYDYICGLMFTANITDQHLGRIVELAQKKGAQINRKYKPHGFTPLLKAANSSQTSIVELLVKLGARLDIADDMGMTPLMHAAVSGNSKLAHFLIDRCVPLDQKDENDRTALMFAMYNAHPDLVQMLVDAGSDIEIKDRSGHTSLEDARERMKYDLESDPDDRKRYQERRARVVKILELAETTVIQKKLCKEQEAIEQAVQKIAGPLQRPIKAPKKISF